MRQIKAALMEFYGKTNKKCLKSVLLDRKRETYKEPMNLHQFFQDNKIENTKHIFCWRVSAILLAKSIYTSK